MSILLIDSIIFKINKNNNNNNLNENESDNNYVIINTSNCLFFLILNLISFFFGIVFIIFYYKIPNYSKNFLTYFLVISQSILSFLYSIFFFEFYFFIPQSMTIYMKIFCIIFPLIILFIYFWNACLTHNMYVTYFKYENYYNKRLLYYKYQSVAYIFIFLFFTLFNINFENEDFNKKDFSFLNFYNDNYLNLYFLITVFILIYILTKLYYKLKKKEMIFSFDNSEKDLYRRKNFHLIIKRQIIFIWYFVITYLPLSINMIIKITFNYKNFESYYLSFFINIMVSFNTTFIFIVKLSDPILRDFLINLLYLKNDTKYENKLYKNLNESFISKSLEDVNRTSYNNENNNDQQNIFRQESMVSLKNKNYTIYYNYYEDDNNKNNKKERNYITKKLTDTNIDRKFNNKIINQNNINNFININNNQYINNNNIVYQKNNKDNNKNKIELSFIKCKKNIESPNLSKHNSCENIYNVSMEDDKNIINIQNNQNNFIRRNNSRRKTFIGKANKVDKNFPKTTKSIDNKYFRFFNDYLDEYNLMYLQIGIDKNLLLMLAISLAINDCRKYDYEKIYKKYLFKIPFDDKFYREVTEYKEYNEKNIPDWIGIKNNNMKNFNFKIKSYSPFIFHHLRYIDKISIDKIISSLTPIKNLQLINKLNVLGGRGGNIISTTWDKLLIIKTINYSEKQLFLSKMLKEYHNKIINTKTILCRIYGLFEIEIIDKDNSIFVLLQKNMMDLPLETKMLTFDLKGSSVDRQSIKKCDEDKNIIELKKKYKNYVLKDIDLKILNMSFNLNYNEGKNLISIIDNDIEFLQKFYVTDYSLLIFIHKYRKEDLENNLDNICVMKSKDNKYIFEFSIIDFLGTFDLKKKGEKITKEVVGILTNLKDKNFSVMDSEKYGERFKNNIRNIINIKNLYI